jgi:hypothetical protein
MINKQARGNEMENTINFEAGKTYYTRSIGDHNCIIEMKVIKRTEKTITAEVKGEGLKKFRPRVYQNKESVQPWGSYSMSPFIYADEDKNLEPDWNRNPS